MKDRRRKLAWAALIIFVSLLLLGGSTSQVQAAPVMQDGGEGDDDGGENPFCTSSETQHPVAARLAETYEVGYEQIVTWFCQDGYGFGQIAMALETSKLTGQSPESLLAQRKEGRGWGQIWKEQGLIGNSEDGGPPPWAGQGRPPWAGPKSERTEDKPGRGNGHGNGGGNGNRPCWAGVGNGELPEGCVKPTDEAEEEDDG